MVQSYRWHWVGYVDAYSCTATRTLLSVPATACAAPADPAVGYETLLAVGRPAAPAAADGSAVQQSCACSLPLSLSSQRLHPSVFSLLFGTLLSSFSDRFRSLLGLFPLFLVVPGSVWFSLMRAQAGHRLRHHHLLQQRHVPPVYEVRPGDFVLVTTRNPQGLRPKMQGPFKVLRVTSQGNVFVQSAPSRPGKPAPQWSVRSDRIVPYRFAHHTNVPHPVRSTAVSSTSAYVFRFFLRVLPFRFRRSQRVYSDSDSVYSCASVRGVRDLRHAAPRLPYRPHAGRHSLVSPPATSRPSPGLLMCATRLSLSLTAVSPCYSLRGPGRPCSRV